jgi:hypothetical protein
MHSVSLLLFAASLLLGVALAVDTSQLGDKKPCTPGGEICTPDGYVGSVVIYEDDFVRVWNFTLAPGEMTSLHQHDHDYHFVAIQPTQLEVYDEKGDVLFDFRAEGVLGFQLRGEFLEPIGIKLPFPVPRVHAAKNIGPDPYYEILYESKAPLKADTTAGVSQEL